MRYLWWAVVALVTYTAVPPLVNYASQEIPADVVALVANLMLVLGLVGLILVEGQPLGEYLAGPRAPYMYLAGIGTTVGIIAYFRALSLGPVSVVVPIYGLFIVTSSVIGVILLNETFSLQKAAGIGFAVLAILLTATD